MTNFSEALVVVHLDKSYFEEPKDIHPNIEKLILEYSSLIIRNARNEDKFIVYVPFAKKVITKDEMIATIKRFDKKIEPNKDRIEKELEIVYSPSSRIKKDVKPIAELLKKRRIRKVSIIGVKTTGCVYELAKAVKDVGIEVILDLRASDWLWENMVIEVGRMKREATEEYLKEEMKKEDVKRYLRTIEKEKREAIERSLKEELRKKPSEHFLKDLKKKKEKTIERFLKSPGEFFPYKIKVPSTAIALKRYNLFLKELEELKRR
jgi:nicotinamidase-related amidase